MDRNEDRRSSINKLATIAFGVTAGAYAAKEHGGLKMISKALGEVVPAASKATKDFQKLAFKEKNYENMSRIIKRSFLDSDSIYKTAKNSDGINFTTTKLGMSLKRLKDLGDGQLDLEDQLLDNVQASEIMKSIKSRFNNIDSKDFFEQSHIMTKEILNNKRDFFEDINDTQSRALVNQFKEYTDGSLLDGKHQEMASIFEEAINNSRETLDRVSQEFNVNMKGQLVDAYKNEILDKHSKNDDFFKETLDRAATVQDLFDAVENESIELTDDINDLYNQLKDSYENLFNFNSDFLDLKVDSKQLRVDGNNQFYSIGDLKKAIDITKEEIADTLFGKLFGMRSMVGNSKAPDFFYFGQGTYDKILADLDGQKSGLLRDDFFKIGDKTFKYKDGTLSHFKEADDLYLIDSSHGQQINLLNALTGNTRYNMVKTEAAKRFDVGTKGMSNISDYKGILDKFKENSEWAPNVVKRLFGSFYDDFNPNDHLDSFFKDLKSVNKMFNDQTFAPSERTLDQFKNTVGGETRKLLDALDNDNIAEALLSVKNDTNSFKNKDLGTLLNRYKKDPNIVNTAVHIGDLKTYQQGKNVLDFNKMLKREVLKESMIQEASRINNTDVSGYAVIMSRIEDLSLNGFDKKNTKNLFTWAIMQKEGDLFTKSMHRQSSQAIKIQQYEKLNTIFKSKTNNDQQNAFFRDFQKNVKDFARENSSAFESIPEEKNNVLKAYHNNKYTAMRKSINVMDIIKGINNGTKFEDNIKKFGSQLIAGRDDMSNVTSATLIPFHLLHRLSTPLEGMGLGFSRESTKSVGNLAKNIGLKRVLPAMAAIYGISYLNYEAENLTGTSLSEAKENAKARFTLGVKTITDTFGIDDKGRRSRMNNPILAYWLGDYQDKEEYLEYLEYGYDPVRKGRFWSFGSNSEFRGGKISYWKPNNLRLAHSNYYDVSVYGSSEEKWKHSWIPTPRHPLAPLRKLLNPYWLENKHYYDRPYPVTGKLFEEGTPWGAVLNPTIGELIKPQKRMHKEHLQGRLTDVRTIIEDRNNAIKSQSAESRIVRFNNQGFMPMAFNPESSPSMNESVFNIKIEGGRVVSAGFAGQDYAESLGTADGVQYPEYSDVNTNESGTVVNVNSYSHMKDSSNVAGMTGFIKGMYGLFGSGGVSAGEAMNMISQANQNIFSKSELRNAGAINESARLHTNPSKQYAEKQKTKYLEAMLDGGSKSDYVADILYSGKQLSGMYGFLFDQIIPSKKGIELEHAGSLSSSSARFWDASVGGLGGEFMEIARRFFPHGNHDIEAVNPIRNTMPNWLPGRFLTGDPFNKVPLGDARLPGAGYETLNKLHSDAYGRYGAFDRYKILADIAPNTEEYKIWKKIAESSIKDPFLLKQMEQIEYRVKEQTKEHDFFDYKFIGKKLETQTAVIEEVTNTGKFKVVGSHEEYSIAGIKPLNDEEGNSYIHQYLKPGMQVKLKYEDNEFRNRNRDGSISSLVYFDEESISMRMFEDKTGKEKKDKDTLADQYFALKDGNILTGHIWEALAHAPIPFIHNKFLRIDSPLEAYNKEQVYGTPYATWDNPIKGFIKPAFQQAWAQGPALQAVGVASLALSTYASNSDWSSTTKALAHTAFAMTNPGGFAGGVIGAIPRMAIGSNATRLGLNARNFSQIGALVGVGGYAMANLENPLLSVGNFATFGALAAKQLDIDGIHAGKGALIGAAVGLGLSSLKNPEFSLNKLTEKYIPKDTKKKWEIEEYFDRLEYVKYTNLFEKAAKKAKRKEGIDIKKVINAFEYNREKNVDKLRDLNEQKLKIQRNVINEQLRDQMIKNIDQQIYALNTPEQYFQMGEYTKAALAYKKAAETTIYGLNSYSSTADVLRALPKYDRDFFLEFAKEKDPKARKKILKTVSPYKKRALQVLWKEDPDDIESNKEFFKSHNLPNLFWSGWNSQVDLDNVKMKTIENEGMLLSDFGMYDSAKSDPAAMMAPEIRDINEASSPLAVQRDLLGLLNGFGLQDVDVTVEASQGSGFEIISNITRVASYNMQERVKSIFYGVF